MTCLKWLIKDWGWIPIICSICLEVFGSGPNFDLGFRAYYRNTLNKKYKNISKHIYIYKSEDLKSWRCWTACVPKRSKLGSLGFQL